MLLRMVDLVGLATSWAFLGILNFLKVSLSQKGVFCLISPLKFQNNQSLAYLLLNHPVRFAGDDVSFCSYD